METWPWPLGYPIITRSAWNTGKALWPLLNVRLTIAKVIFGQILEYSVHCITLAKEKMKENGNSRVTFLSCLACQHFISQLLIGHLPRKWNNGKGTLFSVEQAFVGEGWKTSFPKKACVGVRVLYCSLILWWLMQPFKHQIIVPVINKLYFYWIPWLVST